MRHTVALTPAHDISSFDCGNVDLNNFLKQGLTEVADGMSCIHVFAPQGKVLGFIALCAFQIKLKEATAAVAAGTRSMIPAFLLGKLAVDLPLQKKGLGKALVKEAIYYAIDARKLIGARAIAVHAKSSDLAKYYAKMGFEPTAKDECYLMANLNVLAQKYGNAT